MTIFHLSPQGGVFPFVIVLGIVESEDVSIQVMGESIGEHLQAESVSEIEAGFENQSFIFRNVGVQVFSLHPDSVL
jgi:hypothetical protein